VRRLLQGPPRRRNGRSGDRHRAAEADVFPEDFVAETEAINAVEIRARRRRTGHRVPIEGEKVKAASCCS